MNLSELIKAYGDDKVQFQALDACADTMNMANGHTKITFGTGEPLGPDGTIKMGIVVWMDRDRLAEILAAEKAANAAKDATGESLAASNHADKERYDGIN